MKHLNKSRTMLLLMVLLANLSAFAQKMVGDGFGGRPGYNPVNLFGGGGMAGTICSDNKLYIWGGTVYSTNNGTLYQSTTPKAVSNVSNVRQVAISQQNMTYIKDDGTGYQIGNPTPNNTAVITNAYHCATAQNSLAFVKTDGTVWCDGYIMQNSCKFINGSPSTYCLTQVPGITNAKRVAVNDKLGFVAVMLLADGTVQTFGGASSLYPTSLITHTTPITIPGLSNIVDIKSSLYNFYALTSSGEVYAWGQYYGMGTGVSSGGPYLPTRITFPSGAAPIKAIFGEKAGQALDENGNLYGWGAGAFGQGNSTTTVSPVLLATNVRDVVPGSDWIYAYKNDNTLWGAGNTNSLTLMNLPAGVTVTTFTQLTPSAYGICATTSFDGLPPCVAGTTAPAVTPTTASNSCPSTTVDLTSLAVSSTTPSGASLIWSTNKVPTSAADTLTTAQKTAVSTAGTYYALYYDATNACYSPADSVVLTITSCVAPLTATDPAAQTATTGQAKTGNAATELAPTGGTSPYTYSDGAGDATCVAPSGATALPASSNLTVNSTTGVYTYTAPTTAGTYYYCIKVCDSATPTASCVVKTYTLTVTATASPLTANTPAAQTASVGAAKTGNAATELAPTGGVSPYIYSDGTGDAACVAPSGATALPASSNLTVNSTTGAYTYTAPTAAGTYYYCIKVCDSATPTASCIVKTYTLTVTATACTVTGIVPTFIKN